MDRNVSKAGSVAAMGPEGRRIPADGSPERLLMGPVDRHTIASEVRDRLVHAIRMGGFAPGSALVSERTLSEDLGVARTTVREALQGLVSLGVLERRGNRTFVAERVPEVALDRLQERALLVRELFDVRRVLETAAIALAVSTATAEERAGVLVLAERFSPSMPVADFRYLDREFHASLVHATHNSILAELYGKVLDRLFKSEEFEALLNAEANRGAVRRIIGGSCRDHRAIAAALQRTDPDAAVRSVEAHLDKVRTQLLEQVIGVP
jgi:GntR family transcriptional regulator, transcriptional repressor for pyruvate dehydrogenase complex